MMGDLFMRLMVLVATPFMWLHEFFTRQVQDTDDYDVGRQYTLIMKSGDQLEFQTLDELRVFVDKYIHTSKG